MDELECFPMGSSALLLAWKKPEEVNGQLRGYRIYYQEVVGTKLGPLLERKPRINDPKTDKAKIAGLKPHSKYRITVKATTTPGEGMPYYTECETNPQSLEPPSRPRGKYYLLNPEEKTGHARVKVTWQPQIEGNPGSHFFVQVSLNFYVQMRRNQNDMHIQRTICMLLGVVSLVYWGTM